MLCCVVLYTGVIVLCCFLCCVSCYDCAVLCYAELPYESLDARIVEETRSPRCHSRFNNLASPNAFGVFAYVQIGVYFAICVAISRLSIYRLKTAQTWHTGSLLRVFLPARVQRCSKDTAVSLAAAPSACYVTLR